MIPFVDLKQNYAGLQHELEKAFSDVCASAGLVLGPAVTAFEKNFARYIGVDHGVGVGTGTDALHLACRALGIGPGDEVLVPANTFIASALGISQAGATPVPVDIHPDTYLIDLDDASLRITPKTKAVMPVHLYGQIVDMDDVTMFAQAHDLKVIEDAAQAHGAQWKGQKAGSFGDIGCFSFYPSKNLGALGDGGLAVTKDVALAETLRLWRNYGSTQKYIHDLPGTNSRLDSVQAAILDVKLPHLDGWNAKRFEAAKRYSAGLASIEGITPPRFDANDPDRHVFHLYVIRSKERDALGDWLGRNDIQWGVHYPIPFHLQKAFADLGLGEGTCPVAEQACKEILSLPMFPEITTDQVDTVVQAIANFKA